MSTDGDQATNALPPAPAPSPAASTVTTAASSPVASPEAPLLNVANLLTLLRLVLVPVFLACLFVGDGHRVEWRLWAGLAFAVAALTDRFDGQLARRRGLVTRFGVIADPIADKALMGAALIGLSVLDDLAWWVTVVIAVRELGVTLLRFWVLRYGVIAASRGGKLKTLVQTVAIGVYVFPLGRWLPEAWTGPGRWWLMAAAVVITVATGFDYLLRALRLRAQGLSGSGTTEVGPRSSP